MSRATRDDHDRFMEYNIYLPTRTLYMGSAGTDGEDCETGTDFKMAENVIKGLHILDNVSSEKPITIVMNNAGGDEYHGMAIYDAIRACKNKVVIKVFGHAMSMGSIILQAADERIMAPNSRMMIHYGTWGINDHPKTTYNWADEGKKFDKWMESLYMEKIKQKNPKFQLKKLQDMLNFDTFLTPEEAVQLGLADSVIDNEQGEE